MLLGPALNFKIFGNGFEDFDIIPTNFKISFWSLNIDGKDPTVFLDVNRVHFLRLSHSYELTKQFEINSHDSHIESNFTDSDTTVGPKSELRNIRVDISAFQGDSKNICYEFWESRVSIIKVESIM